MADKTDPGRALAARNAAEVAERATRHAVCRVAFREWLDSGLVSRGEVRVGWRREPERLRFACGGQPVTDADRVRTKAAA